MKEALYSNRNNYRLIIAVPYLTAMLEIVQQNGFTKEQLFDWFAVAYEDMLLMQYESYHPWDSGIHYKIDKLLDNYKTVIYHRLRSIPERHSIDTIISINPISIDAISINCRLKGVSNV